VCGIAGSLGRGSVVPGLVRALDHRGPDHAGWREDGGLAVGAARLRVTGDSRGDMPLVSSSGRTVLVVNGEVFNHRELFGPADGASDLRGLPDLLEREGPSALSRIRGPFALAAFDREARTLLVARDELGVRPLFVVEDRSSVVCASEVLALCSATGRTRRDEEAWAHLLALQFWPRDRTPWRDVRPVKPGSWRRYRLIDGALGFEDGVISYGGGEGDLESALHAAFALQKESRLRTGLSLSGGLDSSAVAGGLSHAGGAVSLAATGWFPGAPTTMDERPWARAVAAELDVPLLDVPITAEAYLDAWPRVLEALGGPLAGPGAASQWLVCRALAREGVGVVFSGQGGDELFGGYERHRLLLQRDLGETPKPAPGYERLLSEDAVDPVAAVLFRGARLLPLLEPELRSRVLSARRALPEPTAPLVDRLLEYEVTAILPGLLAVDDRTTAAFGMEGRVPLLDPVVARLARAIPLSEKSPPDAPRRAFRQACASFLPKAVRDRRDKMGFPVPLDAWLDGPWRSLRHDHPGLSLLEDVGFRPDARVALENGSLRGRDAWFVLSVAWSLYLARPATMATGATG